MVRFRKLRSQLRSVFGDKGGRSSADPQINIKRYTIFWPLYEAMHAYIDTRHRVLDAVTILERSSDKDCLELEKAHGWLSSSQRQAFLAALDQARSQARSILRDEMQRIWPGAWDYEEGVDKSHGPKIH